VSSCSKKVVQKGVTSLREVVNGSGELGDLWLSWVVLAAWIVVGFSLFVRAFRWQ